jgi:hypothetical protein
MHSHGRALIQKIAHVGSLGGVERFEGALWGMDTVENPDGHGSELLGSSSQGSGNLLESWQYTLLASLKLLSR